MTAPNAQPATHAHAPAPSSGVFVRGFLPGLVLGAVIGGLVGVFGSEFAARKELDVSPAATGTGHSHREGEEGTTAPEPTPETPAETPTETPTEPQPGTTEPGATEPAEAQPADPATTPG